MLQCPVVQPSQVEVACGQILSHGLEAELPEIPNLVTLVQVRDECLGAGHQLLPTRFVITSRKPYRV